MASALSVPLSESTARAVLHNVSEELRLKQQRIAEITEMIHVSDELSFYVYCFWNCIVQFIDLIYVTPSILWASFFSR